MKAFNTFWDSPHGGCLLVWSETRNEARYIASLSPWEWEYKDVTAIRLPDYDQYYTGLGVAESNDDLPEDAPKFYLGDNLDLAIVNRLNQCD